MEMKTTVKDFILDNLTDENFEKLVNMLIKENVRMYNNDEMTDTVSTYLNKKKANNAKNNTFEILNEIKKISKFYVVNYKNELLDNNLPDLNDLTPVWMPTINHSQESSEKMIIGMPDDTLSLEINSPMASVKNISENDSNSAESDISEDEFPFTSELGEQKYIDSEYTSFDQVKIEFLSEYYSDYDKKYIGSHEINAANYQEHIHQEKNRISLELVNFIYEVLHFTTDEKLEIKFEQFFDEESHVKIENDDGFDHGYSVHFLLDNRTRYMSAKFHKMYYEEYEEKFEIMTPEFIEYDYLQEDLSSYENNYLLAPFTNYLNEVIMVPEYSAEVRYGTLEQFIHVLTHQGFTKEDQINNIKYFNENYGLGIL